VGIYSPILENMYSVGGKGRPHIDPVLLFNMFFLQVKYNLSDHQLINDCRDRASFQWFLGYPEKLPGETTLGDFRDRIIDCDINL
jgi:transposase